MRLQGHRKKPDDDIQDTEPVLDDYDLIAYNKLRVDFEYILKLLQGVVESLDQSEDNFEEDEFELQLKRLRELIAELAQENPKVSELLSIVVDEIEKDKTKYVGQDVSVIVNQMGYEAVDKEIEEYAKKWSVDAEDVRYEVYNYRDGVLVNENNLKEKADYATYKDNTPEPMPKFKFRKKMIEEFKNELMVNVLPLLE